MYINKVTLKFVQRQKAQNNQHNTEEKQTQKTGHFPTSELTITLQQSRHYATGERIDQNINGKN